MRIQVDYSDSSVEYYDTLPKAILGVRETVTDCDFATLPTNICIINDEGDELETLYCTWSLSVDFLKGESEHKYAFCIECGKPIEQVSFASGGWCERCKVKFT